MLPLFVSCGVNESADTSDTDTKETEKTEESETEKEEEEAPYTVTKGEGGVDFILDLPEKESIRLLQLTDIQLQNTYGARNQVRKTQTRNAFFNGMSKDHDIRAWQYVDEAVERAKPDIIVVTGDNIYGELDDTGKMWLEFCEKMDSYGIPWLTVFGNHDNESAKGVLWQTEQLQKSEHCIFKRGDVTGNCNYSVLIRSGGKASFVFYMLDSNGCKTIPSNPGEGMMPDNVDIDLITQTSGIYRDQLKWMKDSKEAADATYGSLPALLFYHIPSGEAGMAAKAKYPDSYNKYPFYPTLDGDSGVSKEEYMVKTFEGFYDTAKEIGCTGMFVGHQHKLATSIVHDGIRVTYGLKTGTYDYHSPDMLGSVAATLNTETKDFTVEYLFTEIDYETNKK